MREASKVMVLCDTEEEYARLMTDFLKKHKNLPWELRTYTDRELLLREKGTVDLLVVAESDYGEDMQRLSISSPVILNESGLKKWEDVLYVDKYQEAEAVLKMLLAIYVESADMQLPGLGGDYKTVFIGNYSPVRRCRQTSFALTMGQILAGEHRTLYLNFEHYAGLEELMPQGQNMDLADLLYFLNSEKDKFKLRLQTIVKHVGELDYVPPMRSGQNLLTVTGAEWLTLLQKLEELGEYEYVILDLGESMQGLFDILRLCKRVYTMTAGDRIAKSKLLQYEQLLAMYEYEDVLDKIRHLSLKHIRKIPEELEQMTKGDLANLVKELIRELESETGGE